MSSNALINPEDGGAAADAGLVGKDTEQIGTTVLGEITDEKLFKMNKIGGILHFLQGTLMLITYLAVEKVRNFSRPITYSFVTYDPIARQFSQGNAHAFDMKIGLITPFFLYLSAAAHLFICTVWREGYIAGINNNINRARWWEYAVSSSLMIVMIAVLFGCWDLSSLLGICGCNVSMNLYGLLMEEANDLSNKDKPVNWTSFWVGCFAGTVPWVLVMIAFLGAGDYSNVPGFVYGLLVGYFIFFNSFPVNMYLQYARISHWKDYRVGEVTYIWLSLLSKSLLAWLVFGGTNQPNGQE